MGSSSNSSSNRTTYILFAIVTVACALGSLTQTVVNSMLLSIDATFGTVGGISQWLTTIYMLVIGITVPLVAHLSRKMSLRSLVFLALGVFLVGAIVDFVAPNFEIMLIGRVLQAFATGITLPLITTIAMTHFPPGQNGTAMGIAGIAMGFAPNIGPLIGGALVETLGWRSFFLILAVLIALLIVMTFAFIKREQAPDQQAHLDMISFVQSTLGFGGLLLAFSNASMMSLTDLQVIVPLLLGIGFLIAFVVRQKRIEHPLINMSVFSSSNYRVSFIAQNCLFASFMGITLVVPLFVQTVCGMSALDAGIVFIPATILAVIVNPLAGLLSDKIGTRPVVVLGSTFLFVGALSMIFVEKDIPLWLITLMQTVRGIGVSALIGPLNSWGMKELPHTVMMDGSAFFATVRQACASFGTALMMFVVSIVAGLVAGEAGALLGYQMAFGLSALFAACVFLLGLVKVR